MKALARTLGFIFLFIIVFHDSTAQKVSHTTAGGWTVGFGAGTSYQRSDLANSRGYGFDFVIGSQLYHRENAFLSLDWKFRFLAGQNKAYDHRINPDNTYSNIQYSFFNYDLELGLSLNRLRERTGIVLSGFAGAGVTFGRTFTDLYDGGRNLYDFGGIDPNRDSKLVYRDLVALSDGDFETSLVRKAALLPTAGIFIGYQLTRSLTLGVEYKTNFYLTEDNGFFGIDLDNKILSGSGIDRNNYITLGIRWNLRGGASRRGARKTHDPVLAVSLPHPSVYITEPSTEFSRTVSPNQTIRATVDNVGGPDNIRFSQNGFPVNGFTYNVSTKTFVANVSLRDGENSFRIEATNQTSAAEDQVMITFNSPAEASVTAPWDAFNSQAENQHTVQLIEPEKTDNPRVQVVNPTVPVVVRINEPVYTGPVYNQPVYNEPVYTGPVYNGPVYREPVNRETEVVIQAQNDSDRETRDQVIVKEGRPCRPPAIRLIDPVGSHITTDQETYMLRANVRSEADSRKLRLVVNGRTVPFTSDNNQITSSVPLARGLNTLSLSAVNECGESEVSAEITYSPSEVIAPCTSPAVSFSLYEVNREDATHELRGSASGVNSKAEIFLSLDGYTSDVFQFVPSTGDLAAKFRLRPGTHTIAVAVSNACGSDSRSQSVTVKEANSGPDPVIVSDESSSIRFNPGNSVWQFCLITPSGTYSRENLTNSNFSYSGTASSLYFMPIGGGGDATVNGRPYTLKSGQYYLFTGGLNVTVSTRNPGSMGHWSVRIEADRAPVAGNGNNRPKSPCEVDNSKSVQENRNSNSNTNNSNRNNSSNSTRNSDNKSNSNSNTKSNSNSNTKSNSNSNTKSNSNTNSNAGTKSNSDTKGNSDIKTKNRSSNRSDNSPDTNSSNRSRR